MQSKKVGKRSAASHGREIERGLRDTNIKGITNSKAGFSFP